MKQNPKWILLCLTLGFALLDQASKWAAKLCLSPIHSLPVIPNVFHLSLAYNTGAAFSMFHNQPQLLTGFTSLLFLALLAYGLSKRQFYKGELLAMALILGGALGNLLDRIFLGHVTDFLDLIAIRYPIFNVADSFIFCGVILLAYTHLKGQPEAQTPEPPLAPSHESRQNP